MPECSGSFPEIVSPEDGVNKDPMEFKLGEIIRNAGLDESTARYVVSSPLIKGIPYAGKQGRHRRYDMSGAMKVALATWLAMSGHSLADADWLCDEALKIVREDTGVKREVIFSTTVNLSNPWVLETLDRRLFRVYRFGVGGRRKYRLIRPGPNEYYEQKIEPRALALHRFDLTYLETRLMTNPLEG